MTLRHRMRRDWPLLVMVLPVVVLLGVFHYFPTLGNVIEQFILQRSAVGGAEVLDP